MEVNDIVYYARIIPVCDIYEVCELRVRTSDNNWFSGIDSHDKHVYCFSISDIENNVFYNRSDALEKVKEAEKNRKFIKESESYYED